ncbi:hypothetical protein DPMN_113145 [Dreissena polymorpha]|uniref:Uncharacterized protein n=1 Tax=Dreissena polymorpha TaxID=45954 RepID=A0A9D4KI97_DREPO|nr:hypothetical protein DPMN_113145 [Dreissena polymorpha]
MGTKQTRDNTVSMSLVFNSYIIMLTNHYLLNGFVLPQQVIAHGKTENQEKYSRVANKEESNVSYLIKTHKNVPNEE